jgi:hypothetical protein
MHGNEIIVLLCSYLMYYFKHIIFIHSGRDIIKIFKCCLVAICTITKERKIGRERNIICITTSEVAEAASVLQPRETSNSSEVLRRGGK